MTDAWDELERLANDARLSEGLSIHRTAVRWFRASARPSVVLALIEAARAAAPGMKTPLSGGMKTQPTGEGEA